MNWYQVKAHLERVVENGAIKEGSEVFLVKANSFATAERVAMEEVVQYAAGGVDVVAIARKNYKEVFASNEADADKWFKCKLSFLTIAEKSGKEKKTAHLFLVKAVSALTAHQAVDAFMSTSLSCYVIEQVDETKIIDVIECAG
mgnify:FL=1